MSTDTVPVCYVGPSHKPVVIASTGHVVVRAGVPLPPAEPDDVHPPSYVADVPPDVAERLLAQKSWAHGGELDEAMFFLAGAGRDDHDTQVDLDDEATDTPAPAGDQIIDQED